jgi:hypothetical protein
MKGLLQDLRYALRQQRFCAALYDQALGKRCGVGSLAADHRGARGLD